MKLIIGDIHLKKMTVEVVREVLEKCKKLASKCTETIFTGDVNDTKANIRSEALTLLLDTLKDWPTPVIVVVGNHDLHNSLHPEDGHSLESLKLLPNVTVIDKPMLIKDTFYVPYYPEDQFKTVKLQPAKYLVLHQDIMKAKYSNQHPVASAIDGSWFTAYKKVFVGHIHLPQEFDNIVFVGTPYTESYKEANEAKRVIVLNPENDKVVSVPMNVRKHLSFEYSIDSLDDIKKIKDDLKTKITEKDLVRVVINTPPEIEHKIKRTLFKDVGIDGLKTKRKNTVNKNISVSENMNNVEIMERYLKTLQGYDVIMSQIVEKNREVLTEVN